LSAQRQGGPPGLTRYYMMKRLVPHPG